MWCIGVVLKAISKGRIWSTGCRIRETEQKLDQRGSRGAGQRGRKKDSGQGEGAGRSLRGPGDGRFDRRQTTAAAPRPRQRQRRRDWPARPSIRVGSRLAVRPHSGGVDVRASACDWPPPGEAPAQHPSPPNQRPPWPAVTAAPCSFPSLPSDRPAGCLLILMASGAGGQAATRWAVAPRRLPACCGRLRLRQMFGGAPSRRRHRARVRSGTPLG
jgi:hypothetical protein